MSRTTSVGPTSQPSPTSEPKPSQVSTATSSVSVSGSTEVTVTEQDTSEVTEYVPDEVFAFVVEHTTTWRYEFREVDGATSVTESFSHPPRTGWEKFAYDTVARRPTTMVTGMQRTLEGIRQALER